ncbi:MAG TPA: D-2-hydroxyacid dehydrogenase [Woeseiaceae bacterium]|nr:D-2-hydroxyacid dehydrogenase [Woeseiaceae bacterium]
MPLRSKQKLRLVIATPLEGELVDRIRAVAPERVEVVHEPGLLPPVRYPCDHVGDPGFRRSPEDEERWTALIASADILWDIPPDRPGGGNVVEGAGRLRWVQTTSAGVGPRVQRLGLAERGVLVTTAGGIHAGPLTEFTFMVLLARAKGYEHLKQEQAARRWCLHATDTLAGQTLSIVGMGGIGRRIAALGKAFEMRVFGLVRDESRATAADLDIDRVFRRAELHDMLRETDALVLCAPETPETVNIIDRAALAAMKKSAVLVNVARGSLVDEPALVTALLAGQLAFAALDVFRTEPLPPTSPLWDLDNVLVSPHSASTVRQENARLTELFCHNLALFLEGRIDEMRNRYDPEKGY